MSHARKYIINQFNHYKEDLTTVTYYTLIGGATGLYVGDSATSALALMEITNPLTIKNSLYGSAAGAVLGCSFGSLLVVKKHKPDAIKSATLQSVLDTTDRFIHDPKNLVPAQLLLIVTGYMAGLTFTDEKQRLASQYLPACVANFRLTSEVNDCVNRQLPSFNQRGLLLVVGMFAVGTAIGKLNKKVRKAVEDKTNDSEHRLKSRL